MLSNSRTKLFRLLSVLGLCLNISSLGCHQKQQAYMHDAKNFNDTDKFYIHMVEESPLGKPALLREVVDEMVRGAGANDDDRIGRCEYTVQKIIERKREKYSDGTYPETFRVGCVTSVGKAPDLEFVWDVGGFGVEKFEWGWLPDYDDRN